MAVGPGDPAPELPLLTSAGERTTLAALGGEAVLLVFLRHLG
jgi:peroxiredoxin